MKGFFKKYLFNGLTGSCLGMIILTILLIFGAGLFLFSYTHHGEEIVVPDLQGRSYTSAEKTLSDLDLDIAVRDTGFVRSLPPDVILDQSIYPGEKVKGGRVIEVTINAATARAIAIPDLADNSSLREAEAKLKVLGFKLTASRYTVGEKDWVYGIEVNGRPVNAGTRVSVDTPLTLVVGDGNNEDEYNGNDSLDFIINGIPEDDGINESAGDDADSTM